MGLCFSNSVIERGSLAHAELPSPRYMYGSPEVNNLKKGRNNIKSSTLTAPAHLNDKKKELTSSSSVFDLFGLDSSTVLEETKNASVLGTLKSPPTQACEVLGMRWGIYGEKGTVRESMEDRTLVQKKVSSGEVGSSWLFGVLDGHNGTKGEWYYIGVTIIGSPYFTFMFRFDALFLCSGRICREELLREAIPAPSSLGQFRISILRCVPCY